jgi:hypothetical protein
MSICPVLKSVAVEGMKGAAFGAFVGTAIIVTIVGTETIRIVNQQKPNQISIEAIKEAPSLIKCTAAIGAAVAVLRVLNEKT